VSDESEGEWQDWLVDDKPDQETVIGDTEELSLRRSMLEDAMEGLNKRERHILQERKLKEEPSTLEELSKVYGISRERVRQIEVRAFEKIQSTIKEAAHEQSLGA
jgi:RNA polymerase sigma-32 factor